jgi:hypothetical protein
LIISCCKISHLCVKIHVNIDSYMNIPLDNLYHYIDQICQRIWQGRVIIYRFYPHGSKDFKYLETLHMGYNLQDIILSPVVFCNDQEPLNYDFYNQATNISESDANILQKLNVVKQNLRDYPIEVWDYAVMLHSEKQSREVERYQQNGFITVYYWSHAIIARDWFRFAQHIEQQKTVRKTFLIYNRAWAGTREYRLKFVELMIDWQLTNDCTTTANPVDPDTGIHYSNHQFVNPAWCPTKSIEDHFPTNTSCSTSSAKFDIDDYENADIEVVLETLFDDTRWHLTEKSLRPIAIAQPFILVGTAGSLKYLRSYGFKTFDTVWSESYDQIKDPSLRLELIAGIMKTIATWDPTTRRQKMQQAQAIADFNKQHFFSQDFFNLVRDELENNLGQSLSELQRRQSGNHWFGFIPGTKKIMYKFGKHDITDPSDVEWADIVQRAQAYRYDFTKS